MLLAPEPLKLSAAASAAAIAITSESLKGQDAGIWTCEEMCELAVNDGFIGAVKYM